MSAHLDISLPLMPDQAYHIFNRGNEKRRIFFEEQNYEYFLKKYWAYSEGYLTTLAHCLLENHYHLAIRLHGAEQIIARGLFHDRIRLDRNFWRRYVLPQLEKHGVRAQVDQADHLTVLRKLLNGLPHPTPPTSHPERLEDADFRSQLASYLVSQRLRRFFLSYSKSINRRYERTGSLFQKAFRRKHLESKGSILRSILYIHHNPIHHHYRADYDYPFSSYRFYFQKDESIFGSRQEYSELHAAYRQTKANQAP